ncbi:hypothetical protein KBC75_05565 [Candidatus Shapirobacteria bacterium]|nr:hypothetical protein [Candidatus Shapirobacteria bacterium]
MQRQDNLHIEPITYKLFGQDVQLGVSVAWPFDVWTKLGPPVARGETKSISPEEPTPELIELLTRKQRGVIEKIKLSTAYLVARQRLKDSDLGFLKITLDEPPLFDVPTLRVLEPFQTK